VSGLEFTVVAADACVWADHGTGAKMDGSFWRPSTIPQGWFILGDVGQTGYGQPSQPAVLVKPIEDGHGLPPLAPPQALTLFWNNVNGNGRYRGDVPVAIWQMHPRPNYCALGTVLNANTLWDTPPLELFRCVRSDLVVATDTCQLLYTDHGSGIYMDVRCDQITGSTLVSGSFVTSHDYGNPAPAPYWALNHPPASLGESGVIRGVM
jgi:hypothetical protein